MSFISRRTTPFVRLQKPLNYKIQFAKFLRTVFFFFEFSNSFTASDYKSPLKLSNSVILALHPDLLSLDEVCQNAWDYPVPQSTFK